MRLPRLRCFAPLLFALAAGCGGAPAPPPLEGAVVIVLDTLRADRLGAYGHARPTSPHLDALAARGVVFEQAVTDCSWTLPAMISLLSGRELTAEVYDAGLRRSLVEPLRAAGLRTVAFTEGGFVSAHFGLDRGFERFEEQEGPVRLQVSDRPARGEGAGGIEQTFAHAAQWLRERGPGRFLLLVHTYEVHTPYRRTDFAAGQPRGALGETFELADVERVRQGQLALGETELAYLDRLYDGGVAHADEQVGRLLATLAELGLAERTLVVVTADHGEDLGGRHPNYAADHGHALYEEQVRIPLLFVDPSRPEQAGRRVAGAVRILDVMPTVSELLGVAPPADAEGRSLAAMMRGEEREGRPAVLRLFPRSSDRTRPVRSALRDGRHKLVVSFPFFDPPAPAAELYDLEADPGERRNLADREPALRDALRARLDAETRALDAAGLPDLRGADVPASVRERLESLGYVQ